MSISARSSGLLLTFLLTIVAGCLESGENNTEETGISQPDTTVSDTRSGDADPQMVDSGPECATAGDCTGGPPHTVGECIDGRCEFASCEDGYRDLNGDLGADGCECETTAVETYHKYTDKDGDGFGVSTDTKDSCDGPPDGYETRRSDEDVDCNDNQTEQAPNFGGEDYDNGWRCDGTDHDCDGETDEICCSELEIPDIKSKKLNGQPGAPQMVSAADTDGTPEGAASLVAWVDDSDTLITKHLDASGDEVSSHTTAFFGVSGSIDAFDLTRTPDGYLVFALIHNGNDPGAGLVRISPSGKPSRNQFTSLYASGLPDYESPVVKQTGDKILFAATSDNYPYIAAQILPASNLEAIRDDDTAFDFRPDNSLQQIPEATELALAADDAHFAVAWWHAAEEKVVVGVVDAESETLTRVHFGVNADSNTRPEDVAVAPLGSGQFLVAYPTYEIGDRELRARTVDDRGTTSSPVPIAAKSLDNFSPAAASLDYDDDGSVDHVGLSWMAGSESDPELHAAVVGRSPQDWPQRVPLQRPGAHPSRPAIAPLRRGFGVHWLNQSGTDETQYTRLSPDSLGICEP